MYLSVWSLSESLSTRFDNELDINLKLSIIFILSLIDLALSNSFSIGTEKVIYYSLLSPKHLNCPLNSTTSSLIIKLWSYVEPLWNTTGISFGVFHLRLQILWVVPLYFSA